MKKVFTCLNLFEEGLLGFGLLSLAIMAFIEVVSRYLFNHSFTWHEELSRYAGVFLAFLGASLGIKYGVHFSMDFLVTRTPARVGRAMLILSNLITAGLFVLIAYFGWEHVEKNLRFGNTSPAMQIPMWVPYLPIPVISSIMVIRFFIQIGLHAKGWAANRPVGAPDAPADSKGEEAAA